MSSTCCSIRGLGRPERWMRRQTAADATRRGPKARRSCGDRSASTGGCSLSCATGRRWPRQSCSSRSRLAPSWHPGSALRSVRSQQPAPLRPARRARASARHRPAGPRHAGPAVVGRARLAAGRRGAHAVRQRHRPRPRHAGRLWSRARRPDRHAHARRAVRVPDGAAGDRGRRRADARRRHRDHLHHRRADPLFGAAGAHRDPQRRGHALHRGRARGGRRPPARRS